MTSKAFGLQAIDLVYIDYKDVEGLRKQAREGALMGFTGSVPGWPQLQPRLHCVMFSTGALYIYLYPAFRCKRLSVITQFMFLSNYE